MKSLALSLTKISPEFLIDQKQFVLLNKYLYIFFENSVDPDQLASDEAIWSGSTGFSFAIEYKQVKIN